jgi:outer membrane protein TolC
MFLCAAAVFICDIAQAEEHLPVSPALRIGLAETIQRALDTSEEISIKSNQVIKTQGAYQEVRSGMLPHISAQSSWTDNMNYPSAADKTDYAMDGGISASQVLWSFGKVMYAVNAAKKAIDASRFNREAGRQDVIYAAKLSYYSTLLSRNTLSITERSYANVLESKELMTKRSYGGRSSKYEILRMNAEVASRVPTVNEARTEFDTATETLKKLINVDPDSRVDLVGEFSDKYEEFDYKALVIAMREREPSLKSLRVGIESADEQVKSRYAGFLPTLSAVSSLSRSGGSNQHRFLRDNEMDRYASVGFRVDIPLWEGGLKEAQLAQAQADKEIAVLKSRQADKELLLELKKAYLEYQQYKSNLSANIEAVNLADESFKQSQEMFASGQIDLTDLNDAELLLTNQRLNKEMTLFNINITLAKIEKLIAGQYNERPVDAQS